MSFYLYAWRAKARNSFEYRNGPVPFTGRLVSYCYFRHPKTKAENRENSALAFDKDEYPIHIEKLRNRGKLPTAWDDLGRTNERNWKSFRRTQYKAK